MSGLGEMVFRMLSGLVNKCSVWIIFPTEAQKLGLLARDAVRRLLKQCTATGASLLTDIASLVQFAPKQLLRLF